MIKDSAIGLQTDKLAKRSKIIFPSPALEIGKILILHVLKPKH